MRKLRTRLTEVLCNTSPRLRTGRAIVASAATLLVFGPLLGCANSPLLVRRMDAQEVQQVPEVSLCYALAMGRSQRWSVPIVENEVRRRGLSCQSMVEEVVSDCSRLEILNPTQRPMRAAGAVNDAQSYMGSYRVANRSPKPMTFRLSWNLNLTNLQSINGGATTDVQIGVSPYAVMADAANRIRPNLQDCRVVSGYGG